MSASVFLHSTGRHLSSIATIVLRNLGLDGGHQVILYPDVSVHTHLKSTPVSWGPIFDPTYQVSTASLPLQAYNCASRST